MFAGKVLGRKALGYVAPAKQFDGQQADLTEFFSKTRENSLCEFATQTREVTAGCGE